MYTVFMYILQNCCEISDKPLFKGQVLLQDSTLGWVDICIFSRALTMKKHLKPYIDEKKIMSIKFILFGFQKITCSVVYRSNYKI